MVPTLEFMCARKGTEVRPEGFTAADDHYYFSYGPKTVGCNIGALVITFFIAGVPDYTYSIMGPKTLF